MKKGVLLLMGVGLFAYELAVHKVDAEKLKECGIECEIKGDKCIFAKSFDKAQLERVRTYIKSEYGIDSFYVEEAKQVKKIQKEPQTVKETIKKTQKTFPKKVIYSYQVFTADNLEAAKKVFEKVKNLPYARIEKIGKYYVVRVGAYDTYKEAKKAGLKYFLMKCYYKLERIVEGG